MFANWLRLNTDKTDMLWVRSRHSLSQQGCCLPFLQLGSDPIAAHDHVRLLGVTLSSNLSIDRHVSIVSASCFYLLHQFWRSWRSLDTKLAATLVHALVASHINYCNAVLAGALKVMTGKLQRVLNAAARVVSSRNKFDRGLSRLLRTKLHWLDVPERVAYKLSVMMYSCMHGQAPQYLMDFCLPTSSISSLQQLRSARLIVIPRLSTTVWIAFSVVGPLVWILCQTTHAIRLLAETHSDDIWKRSCSLRIVHTAHYRFYVYGPQCI